MQRALIGLSKAVHVTRCNSPNCRRLTILQAVQTSYASHCLSGLTQVHAPAKARSRHPPPQLSRANLGHRPRHRCTSADAVRSVQTAPAESAASARLQTLHAAVAANLPVFVFHPAERYWPCTVEWFLQHCELRLIRKGWKRRLLKGRAS